MRIQLSEHFTYRKLLRFVFPSIIMMIFTSIYTIVDGLFVSNYVGKTPFAALNLIYPVLMAIGALGFMVGTGGSALVAKTLGEGKRRQANQYFSMLIYVTVIGGIFLSIAGMIWIRPIARAMGATDELIENCVIYARILLAAQTFFMLQNVFQSFFVAAEKPKLGLVMTVAAGLTNFVLDYVFMVAFGWGIAGAAAATAGSQMIGGGIPILYFVRKNSSLLQLTRASVDKRVLFKACSNGFSELLTNLSASLVNILYNFQLMKFAGEDGIAAYGVIMYISFIFMAIFFGYSIGSAPIIGYHYGAGNQKELKNLFRKSISMILIWNVLLTGLSILSSEMLSGLFVGYDQELYHMTVHGLRLFSISYLIMGINVFGSAFFTALNNGMVSAILSFLRTLVFQVVAVFVLPALLGIEGIWLAVVVAEMMAFLITITFFVSQKKKYQY